MDKEERRAKAQEILDNSEMKQSICHEIVGVSFKDIEKAMKSILNEREPPKSSSEDMDDIVDYAPEKVYPDFHSYGSGSLSFKPVSKETTYTKAEVQELVKDYFVRKEPKKPRRK
jgi:hypothetical protein